jgi:hypothetical protein
VNHGLVAAAAAAVVGTIDPALIGGQVHQARRDRDPVEQWAAWLRQMGFGRTPLSPNAPNCGSPAD